MPVTAVHLQGMMRDHRATEPHPRHHLEATADHGLIIPRTDDRILLRDPDLAHPVGAEAGAGAEVDTVGVIPRSRGHDRGLHRRQDDGVREVMGTEEAPLDGIVLGGAEAAGDAGARAIAAIAAVAIGQGAGVEIEIGGGDSLADWFGRAFPL